MKSFGCYIDEPPLVEASEYQGKKVKLNDPFRTSGGPKKFSVYVKNEKGNDYGSEEHNSVAAPVAEAPIQAPAQESTSAESSDANYSSDISFDDLGDEDKS